MTSQKGRRGSGSKAGQVSGHDGTSREKAGLGCSPGPSDQNGEAAGGLMPRRSLARLRRRPRELAVQLRPVTRGLQGAFLHQRRWLEPVMEYGSGIQGEKRELRAVELTGGLGVATPRGLRFATSSNAVVTVRKKSVAPHRDGGVAR